MQPARQAQVALRLAPRCCSSCLIPASACALVASGPHLAPIFLQAYAAMMMDEQRQAILISGESGAGKTESAKMVMQVGSRWLACLLGGEQGHGWAMEC